MNIKIIICEDQKYWSETLKSSVTKWANSRKTNCNCHCISSPEEFTDNLKQFIDIDVLFLDITFDKKDIDGMALAKLIRKMGISVPIIFVTADTLRAADGYLVEAMGYLTKPLDEGRLMLFMDRIIKQKHSQKIIRVISEDRIKNIYQKDIVYVEVQDHTVKYFTLQGKLSSRGTLSETLALLDSECFIRIHRSFIVALNKIDNIKTTYPYAVTLIQNIEMPELPVSRKYIKNLLNVYSNDLLERML